MFVHFKIPLEGFLGLGLMVISRKPVQTIVLSLAFTFRVHWSQDGRQIFFQVAALSVNNVARRSANEDRSIQSIINMHLCIFK